MIRAFSRCLALALSLTAIAVSAQFGKLPVDVSGLAGSALPNVASVGASNAAGVLGYCVKNGLLEGSGAQSVLGQLTGKSGIKTSPGYASGQKGLLQMKGSSLSLASLKGQAKQKACHEVLNHAKSFL
jgi:hypothetical protein